MGSEDRNWFEEQNRAINRLIAAADDHRIRHTPELPQPTEAHWRAVGDGLDKFFGRGKWACFAPEATPDGLEPFDVRWVRAGDPGFPFERAAALTAFHDGCIVIYLRSDLSPEETHRALLHELQHVKDATLIRAGILSEAAYEQRASDTAERLERL